MERYETAPANDKGVILIRVCNVLNLWLDKVFYDFDKDCPALSDQLMVFLDRCMKDPDTKISKVTTSIHSILMKRVRGKGRIRGGDENLVTVGKAPVPHLPKDGANTPLMKIHSEEIARQLTLLEWAIWREIRAWECLDMAWTKKDREVRAPHICEAQNRFNRISNMVTTTVLLTERLQDRAKVLSKFIEVAIACSKLNNFVGVLQMVSALTNASVHRLTQTWALVSSSLKKSFDELAKYNDRNSRTLRERIRMANPPCIPFFGTYQTDFFFIEQANPDLIGPNQNLQNCTKRRLIADRIRSIHQYQQQPYILAPLPYVQEKILAAPVLTSEDTWFEMSEWLEPRKGTESQVRSRPRPSGFDLSSEETAPVNDSKVELELVMGYPFYVADAPSNIQMNPNTKSIKYATVMKIVEHMTHHENTPDAAFEGFLASFRSFVSPMELFELLESRWNMPPPKDKSAKGMERFTTYFQRPIYIRVTNLIKSWLEKHSYDFEEDPALLKRAQAFVSQMVMPYSATLAKALQRIENGGAPLVVDETAPLQQPILPMPGFAPSTASLLEVDAVELARQLTLAQHAQFATIRPRECLDRASKGPQRAEKAPNVLHVLNYNEALTLWFEDQLKTADLGGASAAVLTKLLEVLDYSASQLRNWQLVSVVIDAIQAFIPSNDVGSKFANLSPHLWTAYDKYRQILADHSKSRDSLTTTPPSILPLRYILAEIESIEDRLGKDVVGSLINLEKRCTAGEVCKLMMTEQRVHYNLMPVPLLQQMIEERYRKYVISIGAETDAPGAARKVPHLSPFAGDVSPAYKQAMMDFVGTDADFRTDLAKIMVDIFNEDMLLQARNIALGAQDEFIIADIANNASSSSSSSSSHIRLTSSSSNVSDSVGFHSAMMTSFTLANGRPMSMSGEVFAGTSFTPRSPSSTSKHSISSPTSSSSNTTGSTKGVTIISSPRALNSSNGSISGTPTSSSPHLNGSIGTSSASSSQTHLAGLSQLSLSNSSSANIGENGINVVGTVSPSLHRQTSQNQQLITVPVDANGIMTLRPIPNSDDALFAQASALLAKDFAGAISTATFFDENGVVYGKAAHISLDVIIKAQHHYLCSFSADVKDYDIHLLVQVGKLYKTAHPSCALACIVVARNIPPEVRAIADRFKMKVYVVPDE